MITTISPTTSALLFFMQITITRPAASFTNVVNMKMAIHTVSTLEYLQSMCCYLVEFSFLDQIVGGEFYIMFFEKSL